MAQIWATSLQNCKTEGFDFLPLASTSRNMLTYLPTLELPGDSQHPPNRKGHCTSHLLRPCPLSESLKELNIWIAESNLAWPAKSVTPMFRKIGDWNPSSQQLIQDLSPHLLGIAYWNRVSWQFLPCHIGNEAKVWMSGNKISHVFWFSGWGIYRRSWNLS